MTNRINALVVVLDQDIRTDDVEMIVNAIRMVKHVQSVDTNVADLASHIAYSRARSDLMDKMYTALRER